IRGDLVTGVQTCALPICGVFGAGTDAVTADDPADPAPGFGAPVALPAVLTALSRGLSGTEGSLCDSISTARAGAGSATVAVRSSFLLITSTSSTFLRLLAGRTRMFRNTSGPAETLLTLPIGSPFGNI